MSSPLSHKVLEPGLETETTAEKVNGNENGEESRKRETGNESEEEGTVVEQLLSYVVAHSTENDPESVLKAMDEFGWNEHWVMFIGPRKGAHLDAAVDKLTPHSRILELGTFCGYSALRMAMRLKPGDETHIFSVEINQPVMEIAQALIKRAGLSDRVSFFCAPSAAIIPRLCSGQQPWPRTQFDLVFLDHHKDLYLSDAQLLYKVGGIAEGTVVFADNVIFPGCPDYLEWVRGPQSPFSETQFVPAELEFTERGGKWQVYGKQIDGQIKDGIEISICGRSTADKDAQETQKTLEAWSVFDGNGDSDDDDSDGN